MKHWIIVSRGPGWKKKLLSSVAWNLTTSHLQVVVREGTCLRETGKVSFPQISGHETISWHIALQDRQTEAQATTCFLAGQLLSLSSSLLITSKSSSGGRLAHLLVWTIKGDKRSREDEYSQEPWDFPLWSLKSKLLLDKLPSPSLKSWTMLLNDIFSLFVKLNSNCLNLKKRVHKKKKKVIKLGNYEARQLWVTFLTSKKLK